MPREQKKRGKRADKKRKLADAPDDEPPTTKRQRPDEDAPREGRDDLADNVNYLALDQDQDQGQGQEQSAISEDHASQAPERAFYGMLDEDEQEFFKKADETLELDAFASPDERSAFLQNVFVEVDGKELKLACSQSCSRVLERLIQVSSASQLRKLFQKFNGNFLNLVQHRFASHCCEKVFLRAAPLVTEELLSKSQPDVASDEPYESFENMFLYTVAELEGNLGFLITDRFGSHALRILLLVLAGEPLTGSTQKSILQSKRKENVSVNSRQKEEDPRLNKSRTVPKSFTDALEKLMVDCTSGLQTQGLRQLALHPVGSPILQVLLRIELDHFGKQKAKDPKSIYRTLVPEEQATQETESAGFLNGLNYDPVGSHLLETIIEFTPGKLFKGLYKEFWKNRMASLSRNEVAVYVVCKILERIGKEDLIEAHESIVPAIPDLVDRGRVGVIKTLIERCKVRNVDTQAIAVAFDAHFREGEDGFDMLQLLRLDKDDLERRFAQRIKPEASKDEKEIYNDRATAEARTHAPTSGASAQAFTKVQGAILAQAMLQVPGALSGLVFESMAKLQPHLLIAMAIDPVASRTLQATMTSTNASIIPRRKLVQQFYGHIGDMALDPSASHVVDAIWEGTHGLAFIRERIAEELAENESSLRDSPCGRAVWRNWKMDLYKRRRNEWVLQSRNKASNDGFQSFEELEKNKKSAEGHHNGAQDEGKGKGRKSGKSEASASPSAAQQQANTAGAEKTPLQRARERHAQKKLGGGGSRRGRPQAGPSGQSSAGTSTGATNASASAVV